jgi:hypothetical protein
MDKKKVEIPEESIYKTNEQNMCKILCDMRNYISKLEHLVEQQAVLIRDLEGMLISSCKLHHDSQWFEIR